MFRTLAAIAILLGLALVFIFIVKKEQKKAARPGVIKYVALGDSYTIGTGVREAQTWPVLLTKHLQETGIDIELLANPARNGYNTQDVIDRELPVFDRAEPDFVTLMIGTNDWAQGVNKDTFQKNLAHILDHLQAGLPNKRNVLVLTTPDYSITPTGAGFGNAEETAKGIQSFNDIIKKEAKKRGLTVVDIFPISQQLQDNPDLVGNDGLHPSAAAFEVWEAEIYPPALELLQASK